MSSSARSRRPAPSAKRPQKPPRRWLRGLLVVVGVAIAIGAIVMGIAFALTDIPSPNEVASSEATVVTYADGTTEIGRLGEATRRSIDLADVPLTAQHAVLAAEDRDFYEHGGISPVGILRSAINNVTGGSTQGASTITQQYAKNAFLTMERSWDRKLKEAFLAFKLETAVSKDQILQDYLNTIYFGRGAYGIEAASIAYFGKPAADLTVAESAMLAAIIKSPSTLDPVEDRAALKARWNYVLDAMVEKGWLDQAERDQQRFPQVEERKAGNRLGGQTGFLLDMVTDELLTLGFTEEEIQRGGLRIVSTIERRAQRAAVQAVRRQGPTSGTEGLRIGVASVRPGTGEIVAIYGGDDFVTDQINNATRRFAQAGSTFKPFALAAATEADVPLNSIWDGNSPATVNDYTFENYDNTSYGSVTLLKATERSINSAYVELEAEVGVDRVADAALRAGVPEDTPGMNLDALDLTFVLGTASPSGVDMANAYATFAAQGLRADARIVTSVTGRNGGLLYEASPTLRQAFDTQVADTVTFALNKVVTNGTGFAALGLERPAAAKTGTTDDNKSAWFVGYTPQLATAVLMAKEDAAGLPVSMAGVGGRESVTGGSFPAAIWVEYMRRALQDEPVVELPPPPEGVYNPSRCPSVMPENPDDLPIGCPTPEAVEFGPTAEPSVLPTEPVDPATDVPIPDDVPPANLGPDAEAPGAAADQGGANKAKGANTGQGTQPMADSDAPGQTR